MLRVFPLLLSIACMAACTYQPSIVLPPTSLTAVQQYIDDKLAPSQVADAPPSLWWQDYGSHDLNLLIEEFNQNNLELAAARERILKARSLLEQQKSHNWPTLDARSNHRSNRDFDSSITSDTNNMSFSAAYEVDLWGARSAAQYGADVAVFAQQQQTMSLQLQLQATLAQSYFLALSQRERYTIAQQNLEASKELLDLIALRFEAGSASGIELDQQRNTYLATQAQLLGLNRALTSSERAIAVILGRSSLTVSEFTTPFSSIKAPKISALQPAGLLEYRPDIQLAQAQLLINNAEFFQIKKKRWPIVNLGANLSVNDIFLAHEGWTGALLGSLAMPLFDAGNITQQINTAQSDVSIAELDYQQTVLEAMQETLETLSELDYRGSLSSVRRQELDNNRRLYQLAKLRYESGDTDFLNLLSAQRSWFSARDSMIQSQDDYLQASVNVFKAMGTAPNTEN